MEVRKVLVIKKNADMTEGRGPMVTDSIWSEDKRQEAIEYIDTKCGVMGTAPPNGSWMNKQFGDWMMEEVILNAPMKEMEREVKRQKVLNKLNAEERELLGV